MSDFATIKAALAASVLNSHPNTAALMADSMVRQLLVLQSEASTFMEVSGSFATVANQAAYSAADTGFPRSLLRFDRLYYDLGSTTLDIVEVDRTDLRRLQELGSTSYPTRAAWIGEKLQFGPAPAAAYTVKYDAMLDATKNTADGVLITTASTTQTNPWFTTGAVGYKALALGDYYSTSPDQRPDLAATWQGQAALFIASYRRTQAQRLQIGGLYQIPSAFDTWQPTSASREARRMRLFPGAPL